MKHEHSFFKHTEGKILIAGLGLLGLFVLLILLSALFSQKTAQTFLSITAANLIFGRMAGLSIGISAQMDTQLLILFNFFIESIMVLILYPLFVQSWNKLEIITYEPLHNFFERSQKTVKKYQPYIKKYGVPGLILFVLSPVAMTGPVVGSFIGYIIGFNHRKTLTTILSATLIAIILWVYLIGHFKDFLITYSHMISIGFLTVAILMGVWYLMKKYVLK
ncbi:hypothetical protein YH65_00680 [Sulfurovum lithotrophicum]|uniref:Small multi-drug export protein n=1 Tax=Sulfurovum lithotrophicum TaxID=206403 RepID=A0A7U4LZL2_9BACT|nr:small multi-drug export protein [Sulfurovum lithotrophicum]AKF24087.1 hypothetical protein YH65_00680 [Sulfurovum lithotrophicum]